MRKRHRVGLNVAPLMLRLVLGVIFVQAGLGKVTSSIEVSGADAAKLASMGVITPASGPSTTTQSAKPAETEGAPAAEPAMENATSPAVPEGARTVYTAEQFPEPVKVAKVNGMALMFDAMSRPEPRAEDGAIPMPLWPPALAQGSWPVYAAWAVAVTELAGGALVLIGLGTRFWAMGLACVMLGAIWLIEVGPAVQAGTTVLGFIPDRDASDPNLWQSLWLQLSLLAGAVALASTGAGRLSMDHLLFAPKSEA